MPGITTVSAVAITSRSSPGHGVEPARRPHGTAIRGAHHDLVQALAARATGRAEDLARDTQIERGDAVEHEHDYAVRPAITHGPILSHSGLRATRPAGDSTGGWTA